MPVFLLLNSYFCCAVYAKCSISLVITKNFLQELSGGLFLSGQTDLRVWPGSEADPSSDTATPGRKKAEDRKDNLDRLQKLHRDHKDGKMPQVDWADRLAFAELERIAQREKQVWENLRQLLFNRGEFNLCLAN